MRLRFYTITISILILLQFSIGFCEDKQPDFKVKVIPLNATPKDATIVNQSIRFSADYRNVSYVAYTDKTHKYVYLNNKISSAYYAINPSTPVFALKTNKLAYIGYKSKEGEAVVTVDDVSGPVFDSVDNFIFSPDGTRYAYRGVKQDQQCVVVDGKPGPLCKGIPIRKNFKFSLDSKHFAYVALKENGCVLVLDGKEIGEIYNFITDVVFSWDSQHIAYKARIEKTKTSQSWKVISDLQGQNIYDSIFDLVFSYDSKQLAYSAFKNRKMVLVVNGNEKEPMDMYGLPVFSFDSKKLAFSYKNKQKAYISINKEIGPAFDNIYTFYFSLNSSRYAYTAQIDDNIYCVIDGEKSDTFQKIAEFKFSLNSERYSYDAVTEKGSMVIVDGVPGKNYPSVGEPYFSPDSKHVVYRALINPYKYGTILDGKEFGNNYITMSPYTFSKNSKHLAYRGLIKNAKSTMILDGFEIPKDKFFQIVGDPWFSPNGDHMAFHASKKENDWKLIVDGQILDETFSGFMKETPVIFDSDSHFHTIALRNPNQPEFVIVEVDIPKTTKIDSELKAP